MYSKKEKGDIGLVKTIANFTEERVHVSLPISEHLKYDLIAEKDGICKRVQVRFTTENNGTLSVKLKSVWSDRKGNHILKREKGDFDILAVYSPSNDKVYFVDDKSFENSTAICLRLKKSTGNNHHTIRNAEDYENCNDMWNGG